MMESQPKLITPTNLFNAIQDQRHLVIIDLRSSSATSIGNILKFDPNLQRTEELEKLFWSLKVEDEKAAEKEKEEKKKRIRRIVFIRSGGVQREDDVIRIFTADPKLNSNYKISILSDFAAFVSKYPFLCLPPSPSEDSFLFASSSFPLEICEGTFFLGNLIQSNSKRHLESLGIKSLVDFCVYAVDTEEEEEKGDKEKNGIIDLDEEKPPMFLDFKSKDFNYLNFPIDPRVDIFIDFNSICQQIIDLPTPTLLYCRHGVSISPVFMIGTLCKLKKKNLMDCSSLVFGRKGTVEPLKWLYTQLMVYDMKPAK